MSGAVARLPLIDGLKAGACVLIVLHHLCFYGPLADVARASAAPPVQALIDGLADPARMAVQVFLVVAGYLAAAALAPLGVPLFADWWRVALRRYLRLVPPMLVAVTLCVVVSAWVRPWFPHASVNAPASLGQWLAHAALLQDVLGLPALSAGVWYVAIDWQLYALTAGVLWGQRRWHAERPPIAGALGLMALGALSLLIFNRQPLLDAWAVYFYGAYAMGLAAYWVPQIEAARRRIVWAAAAIVLALALWLEWRTRIAVAALTATALVWHGPIGGAGARMWASRPVRWLADRSYAVFLMHFPMGLAVNAVVSHQWPGDALAAWAGLALAAASALVGGQALHAVFARPWLQAMMQKADSK